MKDSILNFKLKADLAILRNDFIEATKVWESAILLAPNNSTCISQLAFCIYKSKFPNETEALVKAETIINRLDLTSVDTSSESYGIAGALHKRLWLLNNDINHLNKAIEYYSKGYTFHNDYYTGENFATCLSLKAKTVINLKEQEELTLFSKNIFTEITNVLESNYNTAEAISTKEKKWKLATLSNCYLGLNNSLMYDFYKNQFLNTPSKGWEIDTFCKNQELIAN